jgi:hypothetical protein
VPLVNTDLRVTDSPILIVEEPDVMESADTTVIVILESTEIPAPLITLNVYIYICHPVE